MKNLEDFRPDDFGTFAYILSANHQVLYKDHLCKSAYNLTIESLEEFEKSNKVLKDSGKSISAVLMWFLSINSYIDPLLELCCLKKQISFSGLRVLPLSTKISSLTQYLNYDAGELAGTE